MKKINTSQHIFHIVKKQMLLVKVQSIRLANYLDGGFNIPSDKKVEAAPLETEPKPMKPLFSDRAIRRAHEPKPTPLYTKGIRSWFNGSANTPQLPKKTALSLDKWLILRNITKDYCGNPLNH